MVKIEMNKYLKLENLLVLRKKIKESEIQQEMIKIGEFLKENNLMKNGHIVTATHSLEINNGNKLLDMEIMVPLDKAFVTKDCYRFKPLFHLVNAIYARYVGNPTGLQNTYNEIIKYMKENNLQQITSGYNISIKEPTSMEDIDNMITDIYIGINPSML